MSRHKNVRNMREEDYDDDYDDDLSSSYGNSLGNSYSHSPSTSQYIYKRGDEGLKKSSANVKLDDEAIVKDMIPEVYKVVNPKFSRDDVVKALRECDYVVADAIRYLLDQEAYTDFGETETGGGGDSMFAMDEDDLGPPPGFDKKPAAASKGSYIPPFQSISSSISSSVSSSSSSSSLAAAGPLLSEPMTDLGRLLTSPAKGPSKELPALFPRDISFAQALSFVNDHSDAFAFDTPSPDDVAHLKKQPAPATKPQATKPSETGPKKQQQQQQQPKKGAAKTPLKKSAEKVPTTTGPNLKSSSGGLNTSAQGLKTSTEGKKPITAVIRPEKRTKQLVDELQKNAAKAKRKLNMVVIGHVDAGKSTLMGHLLHLTGAVDDRTMHKFKTQSEREGKGSFAFAWVLDASDVERKSGVTIDVGLGHFETETKSITLLDAPGHLDFVPNMIIGAAQAEVALLVVDCTPNNFETGFSASGQTKEHALLARSLGVKQMIVVVNKMDSVGWSKERFDYVKEEVNSFLTKHVGFRKDQLQFCPCSGHKGINIVSQNEPELKKWYDNGPTLLQCIDRFSAVDKDYNKPARFYITEVLGRGEAGVSGLGLSGKIEAGIISTGDQLLLLPVGQLVQVKSLKLVDGSATHVVADGDSFEMGVMGQSDDAIFGVGDILCDPQRPVQVVRKFRAQVVVFQPPRPLLKGDTFILHMQSVNVQCRLSKLRAIVDKKTNDVTQRRPRLIPSKATAIVDIRLTDRPLCMELFTDSQQFGRFMLRTNSKTVAAGIVTAMISTGLKVKKPKKKSKDEGEGL